MNVARKSLFSKICAMLIIIALTMSDFLFIGQTAISYAIDTIKTNSSNVDFSAYFLDINGEKVERLEENIDKGEEYLYVDISVKNEGYFNGKISLSNSNFNIKNVVLSENVAEISGNDVRLNQINAGSNVTIKLAIEPINATTIQSSILNAVTTVNLNGQYVNSKNVEKDKYVDVSGTAEVQINWKSSENTALELDSSLLTNAIYGTETESNRVVQILVKSKITNNNYPVKNTNITLNVPEKAKNVIVHSRSNAATNSSVKFSEANYIYNKEEKKVTINVANENETNVSWAKNEQDSFVVTYIFDKEENVLNSEISVNGQVNTYDNKNLSLTKNVHIDKEIDGIVSFDLNTQETAIYKGKIYTGEERTYKTTSKIYVDYLNANKISLKEDIGSYSTSNSKMPANIVYKQIKINKNEFVSMFGNEGNITIKDNNGVVISNINAKSEADNDGNIVINLSDGKSEISIETTKPIAIGTLNIENTKSILSSGYSRETVNNLTAINENIIGNYDEKQNVSVEESVELKNTSSKADFNVSTKTLSSIEENKEVKITAVLLNNDESKDLYQNPTVKIRLPEQVKAVNNAKCKILYANGLELSNANVSDENGNKVIVLNLSGSQQAYNTETLEGTTIILYADLVVDELATNSDENIVLSYTNEIASSFADNGEIKVPVKIAAEQGVIATNNIKALSVETMGNKESQDVVFDIASEEKDLTIDISTINNEDSAIENVEILGTFPTNANLGIKLTSGINITSNTASAKIYYSDKENATKDLNDASNNWSLNGDLNIAKSYLIVIDNMQVGERFTANYTIKVPANLNYNLNASEGYTVDYTKFINSENKTSKATTLNLTTGTGAEISADLKAYVGGEELKDGDQVFSGEVIRYELKVKNNGTENARNLNIEALIPNGAKAVKYIKSHDNGNGNASEEIIKDENELRGATDYYKDIEVTDGKLTTTIENLNVNEEKALAYEVKVADGAVNNTVSSNANISFIGTEKSNNTTKIQSNRISNSVKKSDIEMNMIMICRSSDSIRSGIEYAYKLIIKNTSTKDISDLDITLNTNSGFKMYNLSDGESKLDYNNDKFNIKSIKAGEQLEYEIDVIATGDNTTGTINAIANNMYHSNQVTETIQLTDVSITMKSDNEGQNVETGDRIVYNITLKNNGTDTIDKIDINQTLSNYLNILKVTANGEEIDFNSQYTPAKEDTNQDNIDEEQNENVLQESEKYQVGFQYYKPLNEGETVQFVVETQSDNNYVHQNNIHLSSLAEAKVRNLSVQTEEINHILKANLDSNIEKAEEEARREAEEDAKNNGIEDYNGEYDNAEIDSTSDGNNENENQNTSDEQSSADNNNNSGINNNTGNNSEKYTISGTAWLDENEDGKRDANEKTLSGINVKLLNLDNNQVTNTITSENGFYSISNVVNGKYVAIFEYDKEKYILTKYQVETATESRNSDVENVNMNIDGVNQRVASTDTLVINNTNLTNIDLGLIEAKTFDLSLAKTISSVKISNENGTSNKDYNDANLAKVEVKAKYLNSTTAVIEYKIKVTNNGELAGYARKIADYKPTDLTFNSKLNPDWYQSGDYLYSTALANTKIEAGESKELTLVLTKAMSENNTGLTNNTAEIVETYNSLGVEDIDSIPGNKETKEDDLGSANIIISVSTGAAVSYVSLTLSIITAIAIAAYIATKKILNENIKI